MDTRDAPTVNGYIFIYIYIYAIPLTEIYVYISVNGWASLMDTFPPRWKF